MVLLKLKGEGLIVAICSSEILEKFISLWWSVCRYKVRGEKMEKGKTVFEVSFERGRTNNGALTQTKIFPMPCGQENKKKKIKPMKPVRVETGRENHGRDFWQLPPGDYCCVTIRTPNKKRGSRIIQALTIDENGEKKFETIRTTPFP